MISCKLDITSNTFCDTTILTYEIEVPPAGKKMSFNSFDDEYFTITYFIDTTPN